jgi:16S rRNA pseudouridine516 synthase
MTTERLDNILFSQGFGTRRVVAGMLEAGLVRIGGVPVTDPGARYDTTDLRFEVEGREWTYHAKALVLLHKPAGYECSQKPSAWPSVLLLLPPPLRQRGVQPIGRLDQDPTGLLLLTDDGALIHRFTSPKKQVPKVYEVTTARPVDEAQAQRLRDGVVLDDDPKPVRAAACESDSPLHLRLTLTEGKYHQVKRMLAAVGNRVEGLHRSRIGQLALPADLAPGQWRWLTAEQVAALREKTPV